MVSRKIGHPATYSFVQGDRVYVEGRECFFVEVSDLNVVVVKDRESGDIAEVSLSKVEPFRVILDDSPALDAVSKEKKELAMQRYEAIKPLIGMFMRTRKVVTARANELEIHPSTLYTWLNWYDKSRKLMSLASKERNDKGKKRIMSEVEDILQAAIEAEYLSRQKKSISKVYETILSECNKVGLRAPHVNTVRNRIKEIPGYTERLHRHGHKAASDHYREIKGSFPGADFPLAVVEIDHTKVDINLVDDIHRETIGRPWITLAIDVYSRMVVGFYISFDAPGYIGTGLCIYQSIIQKDSWLSEMGIDAEWPCYGLPKTIHVDNAKEFRSKSFEDACAQYGINIEWRPVGRPEFGAHVERLLGTFAKRIHSLPGTTFSNVQERGRYKSEKLAALTLSEFEEWLTIYITQVYHKKVHSALNMSPYAKYKKGIIGNDHSPGVGLQHPIADEKTLLLDFMPIVERSIQRYGVKIDKIHYWSDVLRRWINCSELTSSKSKRRFIFRRDPRDISLIWFFDPEIKAYYPIPYRDSSHPPISVWELRKIHKELKNTGQKNVDERQIFEAYDRMERLEAAAVKKTKSAKRANQRKINGIGATAKIVNRPAKINLDEENQSDFSDGNDLKPFDEIEFMDDL